MLDTEITCLNCGTKFCGKFCPECGQDASVKRINWKSLFENITRGIFNTDKGFVFTLLRLFYRPGIVIKEYLEGKRKKYFAPFPMMFIIIAFYALLNQLYMAIYKTEGVKLNSNVEINIPNWMDFAIEFFSEHTGLVLLLAMPFLVIALRLCFGATFRKKYNAAEVFILTGYMNVQFFCIMSLFVSISLFFPVIFDKKSALLFFSFLGLLTWDMFPISELKKKFNNIFRAFFCYLLFFFLVVLSIILIVLLFAIFLNLFGISK